MRHSSWASGTSAPIRRAARTGAYFINRLDNGQTGFATAAFSELDETLKSAGRRRDVIDFLGSIADGRRTTSPNTERESMRREFQIVAPSSFPSGVGAAAAGLSAQRAGASISYNIRLIETTETDPAFARDLRTKAGYLQVQSDLTDSLQMSSRRALRDAASRTCARVQVFTR